MAKIFTSKPYNQSGYVKPKKPGDSKYASDAINLADVLEPTNGFNDMDVVTKFNWTLSPLNETVTKEVPYIKLTEYYLLDNYLNQLFKTYGSTAQGEIDIGQAFLNPFTLKGNDTRLYQGMYDHDYPTGFTYTFPYFSKEYLNTSNSWTAKPMFQEIMNLQKKIVGYTAAAGVAFATLGTFTLLDIIQAAAAAPTTFGSSLLDLIKDMPQNARIALNVGAKAKLLSERGFELEKFRETVGIGLESPIANFQDPAIDKPHIWSTTTPRSFNITFPLYNTLTQPANKKWYENILQNWELCHLLCYQNLYNKRNLFTGIPPVFYEIDIPGIHYSKAGYISNLQIMNVGNIRKFRIPLPRSSGNQDVNVPDAYLINMTVTDFFIPSKNFMSSLCQTNKGNLIQSLEGGTPLNDSDFDPTDWSLPQDKNGQQYIPVPVPGGGFIPAPTPSPGSTPIPITPRPTD